MHAGHHTMSTNLAPTDAVAPAIKPHSTTSHANIPEIMESLPEETRCPPYVMRQYGGFWLPELMLKGIAVTHACFEPRPTDIFLVSFPKSGTTWLKALLHATLRRTTHESALAPLTAHSPHQLVPFLEFQVFINDQIPDLSSLPAPRLFMTHIPSQSLPDSIAASDCKVSD